MESTKHAKDFLAKCVAGRETVRDYGEIVKEVQHAQGFDDFGAARDAVAESLEDLLDQNGQELREAEYKQLLHLITTVKALLH